MGLSTEVIVAIITSGCAAVSSIFNVAPWNMGGVPESYACQVLHYMAVSGFRRAQISAMIGNSDIIERTVERDEYLIDLIESEVDEFWESVKKDKMPLRRNPTDDFLERLHNICYDPDEIPLF